MATFTRGMAPSFKLHITQSLHRLESTVEQKSLEMRGPDCLELIESCKPRSSTFFSRLSAESMADFETLTYSSVYPADAILFLEQQLSRGVFVLYSGEVKLSISSRAGKRIILKIAKCGDVLGLIATVTGNPYEVTAETLSPSELAFVRRKDFLLFLAKHPDANCEVVRQIGSSCLDARERLRTLVLCTAPQRLARLLIEWTAGGDTTNQGRRVKIPLTHEEIAEFIGTTRETVTRTLSTFRRRQLIVLNGSSLIVSNRMGLESMSGN